jgi:hypothetical protein
MPAPQCLQDCMAGRSARWDFNTLRTSSKGAARPASTLRDC